MLGPLLIAILMTAASEATNEDRAQALRRRLVGPPEASNYKNIPSYIRASLLYIGFPETYVDELMKELREEWDNFDPDWKAPWYLRWNQGPIVPREVHEPARRKISADEGKEVWKRIIRLLQETCGDFNGIYLDLLANDLYEGWLYRDKLPRWTTHSRLGMQAEALYWRLRSLGWPHEEASYVRWMDADENKQSRLFQLEIPVWSVLNNKMKRAIAVLMQLGFPEEYARREIYGLVITRKALRLDDSATISMYRARIGSGPQEESRRARKMEIYDAVRDLMLNVVGLTDLNAKIVAEKMSQDWVSRGGSLQ